MTRSRQFRVGVGVVLVAVLVVRVWSTSRGTWMYDDWVYMERSHSMSFFSFLFQNYNGHVMPGEFLIVWLVTTLAPLSHVVAVAVTAVGATGAAAVWALALRELGGERIRMLVPLLLITLTPLQVQATIWWAAALQTISLEAGLGGCTYFAVRLARDGRRADRLGLLATFVGTALMWEKAVLLAVPILAVLVYLVPGAGRERVRHLVREVVWLGAAAGGYAVVYLVVIQRPSTAPTPVGFQARPPDVVARSFGELVGHLLSPGLLGGPWGTLPTEAHVRAQPGGVQVALTCAVLILGVLVAWRSRRAAWVPLAMVAAYGAASWGLVVLSSRFEVLGLTRVGYERYAIDTFVVLCLALALLLAPEATRATAETRVPARVRASAAVPWVLVSALFASVAFANVAAVRRIGVSPAREWVRHVTADVARLGPVSVYDAVAPEDVLFGPFWGEHAQLSRMLSPLGSDVRFDRPARHLYVISDQGHLVPAVVDPAVRSRPGPVKDCGYAVGPGHDVRVAMTGRLYDYRWGVQVNAFAGEAGDIVLEIDGRRIPLSIDRGLNAPQAVFVGPATEVRLRSGSSRGVVCVTDVLIGAVTPGSRR